MDCPQVMEPKDWISLATLLVASASLAFGLSRYSRSQRWKVAEFVADEMKDFFADPIVRNALYILEWEKWEVAFGGDYHKERSAEITREELRKALTHHSERDEFPFPLWAIKNTFEHLFDRLTRIEQFFKAGLIKEEDVSPYLKHFLSLLSGDTDLIDPETSKTIRKYIKSYKYGDVISLCSRFGKSISA